MKKKLTIILAMCILAVTGIIVFAKAITINTNGVTLNVYPYPIIVNERTFCTVDSFYSLNCDVVKVPYYNVIILQKGNMKIFIQADNNEYFVYDGNIDGDIENFLQNTEKGEMLYFEDAPFVDNGIFYVPVREVCEKLGYRVEWENSIREVKLTCHEKWQDTENADKDFTKAIKKYFEKLEAIDKGVISDIRYEEGNFARLYEYGILPESDEKYITYREALTAFSKILSVEGDGEIEDWYQIDEFEMLDDKITEEDKVLLLSVMDWRNVIRRDEILAIDMDENLTEGDALKFVIRSVGSTYGCTDYPIEMDYTTDEEVYPCAVSKGFIENSDSENSLTPIERDDFYELLNKALFIDYTSGGYSGAIGTRHIDYFDREETLEKEWVTKSEEIKVLIKNNNLNFTWTKPEYIPKDYFTSIDVITEDGEERGYTTSGRAYEEISDTEIIEILVRNKNEKIKKLKVTYSDSDWTLRESVEYYFYIDFSDIMVTYEGVPPTPGVYYRNKGQWPMKKLSVKQGEEFEKGKFYVIVGKEHKYRKEEYNGTSHSVFKAIKTENTVTDFGTTGTIGTSFFDEVRLMEAEIIKNKVRISSISESTFRVEEL